MLIGSFMVFDFTSTDRWLTIQCIIRRLQKVVFWQVTALLIIPSASTTLPLLYVHLGTEWPWRLYTNCTQTAHKLHTNCTQTVHKLYTNRTQTAHRPHTNRTQTAHKLYTDHAQTAHTPYTNRTQTVHKLHTNCTQTAHKLYTNRTQTVHKLTRKFGYCNVIYIKINICIVPQVPSMFICCRIDTRFIQTVVSDL